MEEYERERFRLVAKSARYRRRLAEAEGAIRQAVRESKVPAVAFSFGKDSLVCLDIARRIKPDILVINYDRGDGGDLEEAVELYGRYAQENGINYRRVKTPKEILEIYREAGSIERLNRNDLLKNLMAGVRRARKLFGLDCEITGLRSEESWGRGYLNRYGVFHYSATDKIFKCKPVVHWKGDEIWAYIVSNDLPYLPWYDLEAAFEGYERSRYSNWAGVFQVERGRFARLRKNYPEEFKRLAAMFPEAMHWV